MMEMDVVLSDGILEPVALLRGRCVLEGTVWNSGKSFKFCGSDVG